MLPKHLDEKIARLHMDALGVRLTELAKVQAEYRRVDITGPFKAGASATEPVVSASPA